MTAEAPARQTARQPGGAATGGPADAGIAESIADLQDLLLETEGVEEFLQGLTALAARLDDGASCGLTVRPDGKPLTVACNDESVSQVDEVQYLLGEGPCHDALRGGGMVHTDDTMTETRWPGFAGHAAAYGFRSCLSVPLITGEQVIGALNLYARTPHAFGASRRRRLEHFAHHAARALAVATRLASYTALTHQLRESLATRAVIDQALGVIMAKQGCTPAEAFTILRNASQNRNVKLREIATEIVASVSGQPPQPPPFES